MNNTNAAAKDSWDDSNQRTFWSDFKGLRSNGLGAAGEATIVNILVQPAASPLRGSEEQHGQRSQGSKNNWWNEPSHEENKGDLLCPRCGFNLGSISRILPNSRPAGNQETEFKIHASQDQNLRPARPTLSEILRRDSHVHHDPFSNNGQRTDSQNVEQSFNVTFNRAGTVCSDSNLRSYGNQRFVEPRRKTTQCEEEYLASLSESRLYLRDHKIVQNMTECWERFLQIRLGPAYDSPKRHELIPKRESSAFTQEFHGSITQQNYRTNRRPLMPEPSRRPQMLEASQRLSMPEAIHRPSMPEAIHRPSMPEAIHRPSMPEAIHRPSMPEANQNLNNVRDRQESYCRDCSTRRLTDFSGTANNSQAGKRSVNQIRHSFEIPIQQQHEIRRIITTNQSPEPAKESRNSAREPQTHHPSTATEILPCSTCNNFTRETVTAASPHRDSLAHSHEPNNCERPSCACTQRKSTDANATSRPCSSPSKIHNSSEKSCEKHGGNSIKNYTRTSHKYNPGGISSEEKVQQWMEKNDNLGTSLRPQEEAQSNILQGEPDHSAENNPQDDGLTIIQLGTSFNLASGEKLPDESLHDQSYFRNFSLTSSVGFPSILPDKHATLESKTDGPPVPPLDETAGEMSSDENRSWKWNYWWSK